MSDITSFEQRYEFIKKEIIVDLQGIDITLLMDMLERGKEIALDSAKTSNKFDDPFVFSLTSVLEDVIEIFPYFTTHLLESDYLISALSMVHDEFSWENGEGGDIFYKIFNQTSPYRRKHKKEIDLFFDLPISQKMKILRELYYSPDGAKVSGSFGVAEK